MRNEYQPDTLLSPQVVQYAQNLCLHGDVKRRCRLIRNDDIGIICQCHRYADPLPHAARERMRIGHHYVFRIGDADIFQKGNCPAPENRLCQTRIVGHHRLGQLRADSKQRMQRAQRVLKNIGDPAAPQIPQHVKRFGKKVSPPETDGARRDHGGRRRHQPGNRERGHRLAGPALPDNGKAFTTV